MIERANYDDVRAFLGYHGEQLQHSEKTVARLWISLRAALEWCDDTPFPEARNKRPTFAQYMATARNQRDGGKLLSNAHAERALTDTRAFFRWAQREYPARYRSVAGSWIDSLRLPRARSAQAELREVESYTLPEVLAIAALPVGTVAERRNQAAVCFLFLSGMRSAAFVTLPISCVDLASKKVSQLPARGVATKNSKAAVTSLLPIPELLAVVRAWDSYVGERLPSDALWFPRIDLGRGDVTAEPIGTLSGRRGALAEGMRALCLRANVPFRSAHKLRHGHALYGVQHARTVEDFKAVSQNLMHSSISITDGIYGRMAADNVATVLARLGTLPGAQPASVPSGEASARPTGAPDATAAAAALRMIADELQRDPGALARLLSAQDGTQ